jgi:hypothetical protein
MASTTTTPQTIEQWLQALAGCLTASYRSDGAEYVHLSDGEHWEPVRDQLQEACRLAHRGELPNDWRFQAISDITDGLLEYCEPESQVWDLDAFTDAAYSVADRLTDWDNSALAQWIADHPGRAEFNDDSIASSVSDIFRLIQLRQAEELTSMAFSLLCTFSGYVRG